MKSNIYFKDGFWCVDFLDENDELLPTVGMFTCLEDAQQAATVWARGDKDNVAIVGQGSW